jgi:hypothetical protein
LVYLMILELNQRQLQWIVYWNPWCIS